MKHRNHHRINAIKRHLKINLIFTLEKSIKTLPSKKLKS